MAEILRHGDVVADTEDVLQTIFVYIYENSLKNCLINILNGLKLSESIRCGRKIGQLKK